MQNIWLVRSAAVMDMEDWYFNPKDSNQVLIFPSFGVTFGAVLPFFVIQIS